ncbi:nitroreductase [bacterium]|nr:nitroreductase [bacterium]
MNTLEAIKTRRSTRKFKQEPILDEILEKIIEAGRFAPCGGNSQTTHFIVISNKKILNELAELVCTTFSKMEIKPDTYKSLAAAINASKKGNFVFHYNAPVLIITTNKIGYGNNMADCVCAIENMMIEANELNLGSCYINQLHWLDENPDVREYLLKLGLKEDETICASMAIGFPDTKDGLPIRSERNITGNIVTYIK